MTPGEITCVDFKLPASLGLQEQVAELHLDPPDPLPSDDRLLLALTPGGASHVLLVEPGAMEGESRSPGLYLRTGIEALAESGNHLLELTRRSAGAVTGRDFQDADIVFLAGVPELPDAVLASLEARVRAGCKSLVVIAGPNVGGLVDFPELHSLLPVELTRESGSPVTGPIGVHIGSDSGSSPFFFQLQSAGKDKLPPLDQIYPPLRKRPAATVLLEAG